MQSALLGAEAVRGVTTEYVSLAQLEISPCNGCGPCATLGHCAIDDDMQSMYPRLLAADALIIGTPVYYGSMTALCKAFLERVQAFGAKQKKLAMKVGGVIATGQGVNGGHETTQLAIHLWMHINDMLPVGTTTPSGQWGATAHAGSDADLSDDVIPLKRIGKSMKSVESAWLYGRKIATVTSIVQAGLSHSGLTLPDRPYGSNAPESYPDELYRLGFSAQSS